MKSDFVMEKQETIQKFNREMVKKKKTHKNLQYTEFYAAIIYLWNIFNALRNVYAVSLEEVVHVYINTKMLAMSQKNR